ncbi:MAG: hypothetical protein CL489_08765 [Acidobacteria bacterium]|nr:hypothetical protein [Acidobacteriota bacterium]|tara:strand:- start:12077 stop:12979 length:903 start_codon:yes stop_codon:yes gene_type:complete
MLDDLDDGMKQGVHLVDFSQIMISSVMAAFDEGEPITVQDIRKVFLNVLKHNVIKRKKEYPIVVIAFDDKRGGYWREKIHPTYKATRKNKQKKTKWDWDTIHEAMGTIRDELKEYFPYITISVRGVEADDIIATLTKTLSSNHNIFITGADGDFAQLQVFPNVRQWNPIHEKWVKPKTGDPRTDLLTKLIKGDTKDSIPNIKCPIDWYDVKEEGKRAPSITKKFLKPIFEADNPQELLEGDELDRFQQNEKLISFEFIPEHIQSEIIELYENTKPAPKSKLHKYFVKNRLTDYMAEAGSF